MPQTTIELVNVSAPSVNISVRELADSLIPAGTTVLVSDNNTFDAIASSEDLYNAIDNDDIVIRIDGINQSKANSLIYMQSITQTGKPLGKAVADLESKVFGNQYQYVERITSLSTTGVNLIYLTMTTSALVAGTYRLEISWVLNQTNVGGDWKVDITEGTNAAGLNTSLLVDEFDEEGIDTGANARWPKSFTRDIVFTAGVKDINIEMNQVGSGTFTMFFACIRLFRVD